MFEIDAQVDLSHPADRVWRALTDPGLVGRWFAEVGLVTEQPGRMLLRTAGLPGFDADIELEVVDRRALRLLVVRCREDGRRTRLTCTVTPTAEGCRLSVREELEHGTWAADQTATRETCYQQALSGRLKAILDWTAFQQVDLRRGEYGATAELPMDEVARPASAGRRRAVLVAVLAAVALVTGGAVWALRPGEPGPPAAPALGALPATALDQSDSPGRLPPPARRGAPARRVSAQARRPHRSCPPRRRQPPHPHRS